MPKRSFLNHTFPGSLGFPSRICCCCRLCSPPGCVHCSFHGHTIPSLVLSLQDVWSSLTVALLLSEMPGGRAEGQKTSRCKTISIKDGHNPASTDTQEQCSIYRTNRATVWGNQNVLAYQQFCISAAAVWNWIYLVTASAWLFLLLFACVAIFCLFFLLLFFNRHFERVLIIETTCFLEEIFLRDRQTDST